jgi:hypothetical protein
MQPSIDNYTAYSANISGSAYGTVHGPQTSYSPVSSIVFQFDSPDVPFLNGREIQLIREYKQLEDNWDGDGAKAPFRHSLMLSSYLLKVLQSFGQKVYHVAPGPSGEILLDLRNRDRSIELLFYEDRAKYVRFSQAEKPDQGSFELNMLSSLLKWLNA